MVIDKRVQKLLFARLGFSFSVDMILLFLIYKITDLKPAEFIGLLAVVLLFVGTVKLKNIIVDTAFFRLYSRKRLSDIKLEILRSQGLPSPSRCSFYDPQDKKADPSEYFTDIVERHESGECRIIAASILTEAGILRSEGKRAYARWADPWRVALREYQSSGDTALN